MNKKFFVITALAMHAFATPAFADDPQDASQSKVKIDDVKVNASPAEDVDEILTNNKMRAESGSKSRYSLATAFNYDGGSLRRPLDSERPNIQDVTGSTDYADLNGQINAKYNMTKQDSFLLGGGLRWITPVQGKRPDGYAGQMFDVFDPSLMYQRIYKVIGFQSYYQVGPTLYTRTNLVEQGYIGNLQIYNVNAYDIGTTGLTLGFESSVATGFYKEAKPYNGMSADDVKDNEADYSFFIYPYLEYQLSDKINLRTVSFLMSYEHTKLHPSDTWKKDRVIQSVGVGFSVTRDVFLYPNVQFVPDQARAEDTNVGLSANINLF